MALKEPKNANSEHGDIMLIQEALTKCKRRRVPVHSRCPAPEPAWIIFRAGRHSARLPFESRWEYVLDVTSIGFRADRVADAIVITGSPSNDNGGLLS